MQLLLRRCLGAGGGGVDIKPLQQLGQPCTPGGKIAGISRPFAFDACIRNLPCFPQSDDSGFGGGGFGCLFRLEEVVLRSVVFYGGVVGIKG